jgi:RNA polymerase sigma-70 factor, ECF subfamily
MKKEKTMGKLAGSIILEKEGNCLDKEINELILPHRKAMYVRALQLCKDPDLAEDLVQDTIFFGIKNIHQIKDRSRSKFWLSIILKNQFLKECGRSKKIEYWDDSELSEKRVDESLPEKEFFEEESDEEIRFLVEILEDHLKAPLKMYHFQNLSYKKISQKLDIPIGTVMSRISRARGHLKNKLLECQELLN